MLANDHGISGIINGYLCIKRFESSPPRREFKSFNAQLTVDYPLHNKYTQDTHILCTYHFLFWMRFIAINRCPALILILNGL